MVRVTQSDDRINIRRIKGEIEISFVGLAPSSLEKATIEQDPPIIDADDMPGTGYGTSGTMKGDVNQGTACRPTTACFVYQLVTTSTTSSGRSQSLNSCRSDSEI